MPEGSRPFPPDRHARVAFNGTYDGTSWANVMWLFLSGSSPIAQADLDTLAAEMSSRYNTHFLKDLSSLVTLSSTQIILYTGGDAMEGFAGVGGSGLITGPSQPASIALCVTWHIAPHYKGGHPRTYLTGIPSSSIANASSFVGTYATGMGSNANAFHAAVESIPPMGSRITSVQHGTVSFVRNKLWRNPPVFYRFITATVDTRIDSQRRRLGRDRPS